MVKFLGSVAVITAAALCALAPAQAATPTAVCAVGVNGCSFAADGEFPALGQEWRTRTAWWNGLAPTVTYDFGALVALTDFTVSLDNNDSYRLAGSVDGQAWTVLREISQGEGSVGWGMDTFAGQAGGAVLRYLRIQAVGGDDMYSVGEFSAQTTAVPEPGAWLLMAGGLGLLAGRRRRA